MTILDVNITDLANQDRVIESVGSVSADQLGTVLAQKSKTVASANTLSVDEMVNTISSTTGLGKYGLKPQALEDAGYIKPGTVDRFLDDPGALSDVLNSPTVWTGKDGIGAVSDVLGSSSTQTAMQSDILGQGLNTLQSNKIISGLESPNVVASVTSVIGDYGIGPTKDWLGLGDSGGVLGGGLSAVDSLNMDSIARGAQFSVDFVDTKLTSMFTSGGTLLNDATGAISDVVGGIGDSLGQLGGDLTATFDDLTGAIGGSISELAGSIGGISAISDVAGNLIGGVSGALNNIFGGLGGLLGGLGGLFGGSSGPVTYTPPAVTQTVNRAGIDSSVIGLINNPKVPVPNYTGIVNAASFQLPSLSGLVNSNIINTNKPITVCSCSDPTLIAPTQSECEAAGGEWVCYTVNSNTGSNTGTVA